MTGRWKRWVYAWGRVRVVVAVVKRLKSGGNVLDVQ